MTTPTEGLLERLRDAGRLLGTLSELPTPAGLTDPEPKTGERWDWGQEWAHVDEFVPYWTGQMRMILAAPGPDPEPFGRVSSDPARIAAIEANRHRPPPELMDHLRGSLRDFRSLLESLSPQDWEKKGVHQTRGVMDLSAIADEFVVKHLEDHARQLRTLAEADGTTVTSKAAGPKKRGLFGRRR